jgi:ribosome-associated toxin RatA of RatAB toxin-antitoxin module
MTTLGMKQSVTARHRISRVALRAGVIGLFAWAAAAALAPGRAHADLATEVAALEQKGEAIRYARATPGSDIETGGASILVSAPLARVERLVLRFGRYKELVPAFAQSRLVQTHKTGEQDVYLEVPVMHGAAKIWGLLRFSKPTRDKNGSSLAISARMMKGNVDDFRAVWRLRAVDDKRTMVKLELFVDPDLPVPTALIEKGLTIAADKGVTAIRDFAEGRKRLLAKPAPKASSPDVAKR